MAAIVHRIITQHTEESAFLWVLRNNAIYSPHYALKDLAKLDTRIDAHLDGLRIAGAEGWKLCAETLASGEAGEVFAAGVMAFESGDAQRIQTVLDIAVTSPELSRGAISALGWLPYAQVEPHVRALLNSDNPNLRRIGIAASAVHRVDPGSALIAALNDSDVNLKSRALRAVGELGRSDLVMMLQREFHSTDEASSFWSTWSAARLGDGAGVQVLKKYLDHPVYQRRALQMVLRCLPRPLAENVLSELIERNVLQRLVVEGMGVIGNPSFIPVLLNLMAIPEVARVAGESFTMITGVDLAYQDLEQDAPKGFEAGPTENPEDEDVSLDPDEDLPWPNPQLVEKWWERNKSRFREGQRYLLGEPIDPGNAERVLRVGRQRQRNAAALELALMNPSQPLFETRAPGFRQQQLLGLK
jgi:uncharacterized protein (TIGR02270 family)